MRKVLEVNNAPMYYTASATARAGDRPETGGRLGLLAKGQAVSLDERSQSRVAARLRAV